MLFTQKPKFHRLRNQMNISSKKSSRKNNFPRILCFPSAMSHIHISTKNGISGKSAEYGQTSQKNNFFENGRMRLVYDSFWPQGPPKLQKIGLGWFPQLTRPPRPDSWFFRIFSEISKWVADLQKPISWASESEKNVRKLIFSKCFDFPKNYDT